MTTTDKTKYRAGYFPHDAYVPEPREFYFEERQGGKTPPEQAIRVTKIRYYFSKLQNRNGDNRHYIEFSTGTHWGAPPAWYGVMVKDGYDFSFPWFDAARIVSQAVDVEIVTDVAGSKDKGHSDNLWLHLRQELECNKFHACGECAGCLQHFPGVS
jgi:hypothetical protein